MNTNYELSYWERIAEEQLRKPRGFGFTPHSIGRIRNNRKRTNGRKIQIIISNPEKKYPEKQIRKN